MINHGSPVGVRASQWLALRDAAQDLLDNADDMGESRNDDGEDYDDFRALRKALKDLAA